MSRIINISLVPKATNILNITNFLLIPRSQLLLMLQKVSTWFQDSPEYQLAIINPMNSPMEGMA